MPLNGQENQTATTPGRRTHLYLNTGFPVLQEAPLWWGREKEQIARRGLDNANSQNVRRYACGAIGLIPVQMQAGKLHERSDTSNGVIPLSEWNTPTGMFQARSRFRQQTELTGVTYAGSVQASGDSFARKIVEASASWAQSVADAAYGAPTFPTANVPMDRVMVGRTTDPANQGYVARFEVPGTKLHSPDMLMDFLFGGPASADGGGSYALGVDGTGIAILFERINGSWVDRFSFRYAPPDRIAGVSHKILIKPYNFPGIAGGIEFICSAGDIAAPVGSLVQGFYNNPTLPTVHLYTIRRRATSGGPTRPTVTGANTPRVDIRRDLRPHLQISRVKFPNTGYFVDGNLFVPFHAGTSQNLVIEWTAVVPSGCGIVGKLYRADTNVELTLVSSSSVQRVYQMVSGLPHYYARFEYTADVDDTALLWDYQVYRNGTIITPVNVEVDASENLLNASVSGAESDPSHETASLMIDDPTDRLTALNRRGRVSYRLETEYDPANPNKRSVLSEGFLIRSPGRRKMRKTTEGLAGTRARAYPAKKWREYAGAGVGMWIRLNEKVAWQVFRFFQDPDAPELPWKITDIVRRMINYAGYPLDMIDVPDNPMRLWTGNQDYLALTPMQPIGQFCVDLLKNYLGWFLVWDANAGTRGKWRAVAPSVAPYQPLARFYTQQVTTGRLAHSAGAYNNTNAGYWSENGSVNAFIQGGTLETWVKPPEANAILVIGGGGQELNDKRGNSIFAQWLINRDGLNFFSDYTPDPNHPDWIGELVPLVYVDQGISSQPAANFFCRRLYDIATHGIKMARFAAPLVLITESSDSQQRNPRPLRYYDPVEITDDRITETWLIRNCNPNIGKSAHQMALYECEAPRF